MRFRPIALLATVLITALLLAGCGKSKEIEIQDISMSVTDPNFPAPFCADRYSNNLEAKRLNRSPEFYSNLCGFAVIRVIDASNWATGLIEAEYDTIPVPPTSDLKYIRFPYRAWFVFHNVADAKELFVGDFFNVKLYIYPDPKDPTHISFVIWSFDK